MFTPAFHPARGHRPYLRPEIDFRPPCAEHLAGPGGGEDCEFKCPGRNSLPLAQLRHKRADLVVRERGMVLNRTHLGPAREQLIESAFPARRIIAVAEAPRGCPIKHR